MSTLSDLPKTFVVLSVHRSGSSFVARALEEAGVVIHGNGNGHLEDPRFAALNREILADAGGVWQDPPSREAVLRAARKRERDIVELVDALQSESDLVGWKEPRQALTLDGFLPHLNGDVYLVALFRKPRKVARSMSRIRNLSEEQALELAREYDRRLLATISEFIERE